MKDPQPGDIVLYGPQSTCVARVSDVTVDNTTPSIIIKNDNMKTSAIIPNSCITHVIPQSDIHTNIPSSLLSIDSFPQGSDFFTRRLNPSEATDIIQNHAATIIQRSVIKKFYTPPHGLMYKKLNEWYSKGENPLFSAC